MKKIYLSVGGNEGDVVDRLMRAFSLICSHPAIYEFRFSHFYSTSPVEMNSHHSFVNATCSFSTSLSLDELFLFTQSVEQELGKVKKPKNADRPIDIDILFFGNQYCHTAAITIPHRSWKDRLFVLVPLRDLIEKIVLQKESDTEIYFLQDLITPLLQDSSQSVSLLVKNPHIQ